VTAEPGVEVAAAPSTTSTAPPPPSTTSSTGNPGDTPKPKSKSDQNDKADRGSISSSSTTTTTSKKTTTTTSPPRSSKPPTSSSQQSPDTRTISSGGGVVAVRYTGGKVQLLWARPNAGYQVYVRSTGPDTVVVYFYTRNQLSRVRAYYSGGLPASDVKDYSGSNPQGQIDH